MNKKIEIIVGAVSGAILAILICIFVVGKTFKSGEETVLIDSPNNITTSTVVNAENIISGEDNGNITCKIILSDNGVTIDGSGASADGTSVVINSAGCYELTGSMTGSVKVKASENDAVTIILSGVSIANDDDEAILFKSCKEATLVLTSGTQNSVSGGEKTDTEEASGAAIKSNSDLIITGSGTLNVEATNDGIKSKAGIKISGGKFIINSVGDGISAETALVIEDGDFTVTTNGGANPQLITEQNNGFQMPGNGTMPGSGRMPDNGMMPDGFKGDWNTDLSDTDSVSSKGLKAGESITINGGNFSINSYDDSIHSNGVCTIENGVFRLASSDDGIHADNELYINNGTIAIDNSYEGIEACQITINGGDIEVNSSDDGLNASSGSDYSVMPNLIVNGGKLAVNAAGDGLDSNGNLIINGGEVYIDGPTNSANGALDSGTESGGSIVVNGGTVIAIGASGMAEKFGSDSSQCSFITNINVSAGDVITVADSNGNVLISYTAKKGGDSVVFSSASMSIGQTYTVTAGVNETSVTLNSVSEGQGSGFGGFGGGFNGQPGNGGFRGENNGQPGNGGFRGENNDQPGDGGFRGNGNQRPERQ